MANKQNLRTPSTEEAREMQKKSAKARSRNIQERKDLKKCLEILLEGDMTSKDGKVMPGAMAISTQLVNQALKGNVKAFEVIRSTIGQDPVQKVMVAEIEQEVIDEVERMVTEEEDEDD